MQNRPHTAAMSAHSGIASALCKTFHTLLSGGDVRADTATANEIPPDISSPDRVSISSLSHRLWQRINH